jgi:hypothetical protein
MSDKTTVAHIQAAYEVARRHAYDQWKAERKAELNDTTYKKWDGRGFHSVSLEVGRMYAYSELLGGTDMDLQQIRSDAREDAQAEWREEVFKDFLPPVEDEAEAA